MQVTQSHSNALKAFFSYKYASWKLITCLGASSSLHTACYVVLCVMCYVMGRARGECLGESGGQSSHYGPGCIKKNNNYFSRNLSTFVFKSNTRLVKSNTIHLSCCKTTTLLSATYSPVQQGGDPQNLKSLY